MKAEELRQKAVEELREQLLTLKKEAFNLRFQRASGDLENTDRIRQVRRDTARVSTVLNEKLRAGGASGDPQAVTGNA